MGEWAALLIHVPGQSSKPIGVLLRDVDRDTLHVRLKNQWWHELVAEDGSDLWSCLANDIEEQAQDLGAGQYLDWLASSASHMFQLGPRREIRIHELESTLVNLYSQVILGSPEIGRSSIKTLLLRIPRARFAIAASVLLALIAVPSSRHKADYSTSFRYHTRRELPALTHFSIATALHIGPVTQPISTKRTLRRRIHKFALVPRGVFKAREPVQSPIFRVAHIDASPPRIALDTSSTVSFGKQLPMQLPDAPKYRSRHRIVRILSTLATPFKELGPKPQTSALRQEGPEGI